MHVECVCACLLVLIIHTHITDLTYFPFHRKYYVGHCQDMVTGLVVLDHVSSCQVNTLCLDPDYVLRTGSYEPANDRLSKPEGIISYRLSRDRGENFACHPKFCL